MLEDQDWEKVKQKVANNKNIQRYEEKTKKEHLKIEEREEKKKKEERWVCFFLSA